MDSTPLVEREVMVDGRTTLRLLMPSQPRKVDVYRLDGNMLDVSVDDEFRARFWFPFMLSGKKVKYLVNNRAVIIDLYS